MLRAVVGKWSPRQELVALSLATVGRTYCDWTAGVWRIMCIGLWQHQADSKTQVTAYA